MVLERHALLCLEADVQRVTLRMQAGNATICELQGIDEASKEEFPEDPIEDTDHVPNEQLTFDEVLQHCVQDLCMRDSVLV